MVCVLPGSMCATFFFPCVQLEVFYFTNFLQSCSLLFVSYYKCNANDYGYANVRRRSHDTSAKMVENFVYYLPRMVRLFCLKGNECIGSRCQDSCRDLCWCVACLYR